VPTRVISTKFAIQGESEYRSSVSRINGEIKALQSGLKLVESQYQTNANSLEALTAKHDALQKVQEAQKRKVDELRSALENAKTAETTYTQQKEELSSKIAENNKRLEELKKTAGDTSEEEKKLNEENKSLTEQLQRCEENLTATEKGISRWENQLNNAEIALNNTDAELRLNSEYMEEAKNSTDGCATSIDRFGKRTKEASDATDKQSAAIGSLAAALVASGIKKTVQEVAEALEACVSASADFEYAMSGVAAIASASSGEMKALAEKAKMIGASTVFTAGQAADALQYMALAGWSAEEMLSGIDGVISLAAASGEDLARVSDIVTDSLTAFGMSANDTQHFVDILAKTAASSNTTVTMLGEAMKYAAPVAGALGYSVEDVSVAMGLMANNGIKGSMAGTTLRNVFSALTGEVKLSGQAFGEVEITTSNADGTMKSLSETLNELRGYFDQMTDVEKTNNAQALAGTRAYAGLLAILNSTEQDYAGLTTKIKESTGAAKAMANTRMDNLKGDVTLLDSAFDALKIEVGDQLNPAIREFVESGTDITEWATQFIKDHKELVPIISAVTAGLATLTAIVLGYTVAVNLVIPALKAFFAALASNPVLLVATAIATLTAALIVFSAQIESDIPSVKELTEASRDMQKTLEESGKALTESLDGVDAAASLADKYITKLEEMEAAGLNTTEQQKEYHKTLLMLCDTVPELAEYIDLENDEIIGGTAALRENTEAWKQNAKQQAYQQRLTELYSAHADVLLEAEMNTLRLGQAEEKLNDIQTERGAVIARQNELMDAAQQEAEKLAEETGTYVDFMSLLSPEYDELSRRLEELVDDETHAQKIVDSYTEAIEINEEAVQSAKDEIALMEQAVEELTAAQEKSVPKVDAHSEALKSVQANLQELAHAYKEAYDAARDSIDNQIGLWEKIDNQAITSAQTLQEAVDSQIQFLQSYSENMDSLLARNIEGIEEFAKNFSDGSKESAAALAGLATASDEEIRRIMDSMARVDTYKDSLASVFASLETNLTGTLDNLAQEYADTIEEISGVGAQIDFGPFIQAVDNAFSDVGVKFESVGSDVGDGLAAGIDASMGGVSSASTAAAQTIIDAVRTTLDSHSPSVVMENIGSDVDEGLARGIESSSDDVISEMDKLAGDLAAAASDGAEEAVTEFDTEFSQITNKTQARLDELKAGITASTDALPSSMESVGRQMVDGMIRGLNNRSSTLYWTISSIVNNAIAQAKSAAAVASPSKKTTQIFEYVGEGMIVGIEKKRRELEEKMQSVVDSALNVDVKNNLSDRMLSIDDRTAEVACVQPTEISTNTKNYKRGDTIINVYGTEGQDVNELARQVSELIQDDVDREEAVWA